MSDSPMKKAKFFEEQQADQPSRTPSPEVASQSSNAESDSGPRDGSSDDPSSQVVSSSTSGFLRNEKFWVDCLHFSHKARKLSPSTADNFVENLSAHSIYLLHQKIFTLWVNFYSTDKPSGSTDLAALSSDEPKETKCDLQPTTSTVITSSILDMVRQELKKLRNSDQAAGPSNVSVNVPQTKNDPRSKSLSPESQEPTSTSEPKLSVELMPEEMADPLDLLLRLIDLSNAELNKIETEGEEKTKASELLLRPSTLPAITITSSQEETTEIMKSKLYEDDLLRRFRDSLEIEAQKLADRIRALVEEPKPETDSSSRAIRELNEPKGSTRESFSSKMYQPLNEDSKAPDLSVGWTEVEFAKDTTVDSTSFEAKAANEGVVPQAIGDMRSVDPSRSRKPSVADDTLRDVPSLPFDSPSSEVEPLALDSPCTEEETEL